MPSARKQRVANSDGPDRLPLNYFWLVLRLVKSIKRQIASKENQQSTVEGTNRRDWINGQCDELEPRSILCDTKRYFFCVYFSFSSLVSKLKDVIPFRSLPNILAILAKQLGRRTLHFIHFTTHKHAKSTFARRKLQISQRITVR